jgi:segregation and condensation protein A
MEAPVYHLENVVQSRSERENFDGPLDLILTLLSRNKMEIQDIQISLLLEQYMEWMNQQKELNLDVASEFVSMASHLVYIKTKMLLAINDGEEISELSELVAALEERKRSENYSRVKVLLPQLQKRYESGVDYLSRGQLPVTPDKTYRYQHPPEDLYNAMMELLRRSKERPVPPCLPRHRWTGALSCGGQGTGSAGAFGKGWRDQVPSPVPFQPQPFGNCCHFFGSVRIM